ncbi:MAG: AsnC family transcriptional regulator [Candidatus Micrarchaeota archaeon]|nr:AsnC family transcriptional regulator [Candidatus Micrarchaeota archaeon]MDE1847912.1 AsnC family transcriptional regulator [Candidatus Micrarchaeota archaeon]MDE1864538.1 AsnC family transcriptional regulator [Candidatus Micrarchaeota archaeon]
MDALHLKDRRILYQLDLNARQSDSEIAKKIGLSRDAVSYRINNLVKWGYIKYFVTIINTTKLGYDWYRTLFRFQNLSAEKETEIIDYLAKRVTYITRAEGQWDFITSAFFKNVYEYRDFIREFVGNYSNYIERSDVAIITRMWSYHRNYLLGEKREELNYEVVGFDERVPYQHVQIDEIDYKILVALSKNGRAKTVEIARQIGSTEMVVKYRMNKLIENGIILAFRPIFDARKLGYFYFKVNFSLHNISTKNREKILSYIHQYNNIIYSMELIGGSDLETHIEVKNTDGLYKYIEDMRREFGGIIRDHWFMEYKKEIKFEYLPEMNFAPSTRLS